ncbi:hypothetical protein THTE_4393 [Thermogutta terrifontis]|uniref:Uncharacterized protein n=1 Tax=Thermogutta terrifontis TaxID=1331910 RepID=A0A286RLZ8_9BACT|nr:hypothetical protein THTE_4393 [Thermogutta terrifontis]
MSGPSFNVGSSIPFRRGLKSRAESGAEAPHSTYEVHWLTLDDLSHFTGHDKRAPPKVQERKTLRPYLLRGRG